MKYSWSLQCALLVGVTVWAATDPLFEKMIGSIGVSFFNVKDQVGGLRASILAALAMLTISSLVVILIATLGRSTSAPRHRSVRSLFAITTLIAGWCALAIHHDAIAWHGKRLRFISRVDELEKIAAPLRLDWPAQDGELPVVGPFMAYPFGTPSVLILLQSPRLSRQSVWVSAIERNTEGALKLQLTGNDGGDWAEWHPPGSRPSSFIGGVADAHKFDFASEIGDGWYLVRYDS